MISAWSDDGIVLVPDFLVLLYSYLGQPGLLPDHSVSASHVLGL